MNFLIYCAVGAVVYIGGFYVGHWFGYGAGKEDGQEEAHAEWASCAADFQAMEYDGDRYRVERVVQD
jgi:hypothetical protein